MAWPAAQARSAVERDPVTMSVVVVNPSEKSPKATPVRIDLPQEITPTDVLDKGELALEYDDDRKSYYVFKDSVELQPKETRVFQITMRDKWFIPDEELNSLVSYTNLLVGKLKGTEYAASANQLSTTILGQLKDIGTMQRDESLSRKSRIGAYRINLQTIARIKEDLARMEKLLTFTGGTPVPEMLEESPLKADAPSQTTTWLVIFLIVIFIGLLGGQFFFTWHRRTQAASDLHAIGQSTFGSLRQPNAPHPPGPSRAAGATTNGNGATAASPTPPR